MPQRSFEDILYGSGGGIATMTLNRPKKLNAFRNQTLVELDRALSIASKDRSVGVIVLTGAGDKAFCVGGDIAEMQGLNQRSGHIFVRSLFRLGKTLLMSPKPTIAKVNGWCLGGGNELQLFCDLTIASDRSVFGQSGPKVGSAPLWGGTQILPRLVGLKKAKEIMFLCQTYTAAQAADLGMINQAVPEGELDKTVQTLCQDLLQKSPQSLRLLRTALHRDLIPCLKKDLALLQTIYGSSELKEGMTAFLEKREPRFRL